MNKYRYNFLFKSIVLSIITLVAGSCNTSRTNMTYFSDLKDSTTGVLTLEVPNIRIVPDDILSIGVTSLRPEATAIYNGTGAQQNYRVGANGDITFPVLGKIHVEGMTTQELAAYLTERIEETVVDPYVRVELINFRIEVLGEVNRPGVVPVSKEQFTILDALAAVNDLTPYAQRDNILLLRQDNGKTTYHHINLNDSRLMESPLFYLKQNDVIIVDSNDVKKDISRYNTNNAYKLQVISTIVSASSVLASLAIALLVK